MVYYWLIFVLFLLLTIGGNKNGFYKGDVLRLIVPLVCLFIFFAFRIGFTPDYYNYEIEFDSNYSSAYNDDTYRNSSELLYLLAIRTLPYRTALIIQTALLCICMFVSFKYSPRSYWWLVVVMLFTYKSFILGNISAYRSSFLTIAVLLMIFARAYLKRGWIYAILLIYVSSLIHHSAIILLPFVLLSNKPVGDKKYGILLVLASIVIFMSLFMANTINVMANSIFEQFTDGFETYKQDSISNIRQLGFFSILRWFMLGYLLYVTLKYTRVDCGGIKNICIKMTAIFFLVGFLPGILLIDRITYNMAFPVLIGVSTVAERIREQEERILYVGLAILYGIWEMYLLLSNNLVMSYYSSYQNIIFN